MFRTPAAFRPGSLASGAGIFSLVCLVAWGVLPAVAAGESAEPERVTQKLVPPPFVPEHEQVAEGPPRIVEVRMVIEEKEIEVEPGAHVWAFSFEGSVPGPLIVVHQDDYVELTLENPASNQLMHNIDFHAATGAMGGGELTQVNPGEQVVLRFKATKPGVFVYHCAPGGAMVPWHVVHGMNGAILVLPRDGLRDARGRPIRYDRAYYVGEQDYYLPKNPDGTYKRYPFAMLSQGDDLEVMRKLIPTHVVFNGRVGALTGEGALQAKVGETVLVLHSQANRPSYPHLIGGHGDHVWERGNLADPPLANLESWEIAAGSAGAFVYTFRQPGLYAYLSHNLIEAFLLGAAAHFRVEGEWDHDLMTQVRPPEPIPAGR